MKNLVFQEIPTGNSIIPLFCQSIYTDGLTIHLDYSKHAIDRMFNSDDRGLEPEEIIDILSRKDILSCKFARKYAFEKNGSVIIGVLYPTNSCDDLVLSIVSVLSFHDGRKVYLNDVELVEDLEA